jgi:radical SAM superfamily enzyme
MAGLSPFSGTVYQIMQLQKLVNMFGGDLLQRYGQKVHKLTLHGGFSCPNRDGTIGRGGCTFCNVPPLPTKPSSITLSLNSLPIRPAW